MAVQTFESNVVLSREVALRRSHATAPTDGQYVRPMASQLDFVPWFWWVCALGVAREEADREALLDMWADDILERGGSEELYSQAPSSTHASWS